MRVKDPFIDKLIETKAQIAIGEDKFYIERSLKTSREWKIKYQRQQ